MYLKLQRYRWFIKPFLTRFYWLKHQWKFWWFEEHRNIQIGKNVFLHGEALLSSRPPGKIEVGEGCYIHAQARLNAQGGFIRLGRNVSINPFSILYGHGGLIIGDNVMIASHCTIIPANHRFEDSSQLIGQQGESRKGIHIADDVWIGSHVTILDGVTIGSGAVIAAGAVVNSDVPPYALMGGVPGRILKIRQ